MPLLRLFAVLVLVAIPPAQAQTYAHRVLHRFAGPPADGAMPSYGSLIQNAAGNLYGTTTIGGAYNYGAIFKIDSAGTLTLLYSFTGGADGLAPQGGVIRDPAGNFYGTTVGGGLFGYGAVFELSSSGSETVLYSFTGGADGAHPYAGVIRDPQGNLYGTTYQGGVPSAGAADGNGVVFKLDTAGTETVFYTFTGAADGANPWAGSLLRDSAGNLYGATVFGGSHRAGVIFKLDTSGTEMVLHEFTRGADGAFPRGGLVQDSEGNLYGTAEEGGTGANCCGVVFKLDPAGNQTVLYTFTGDGDGAFPWAGVVRDPAGTFTARLRSEAPASAESCSRWRRMATRGSCTASKAESRAQIRTRACSGTP